jgi:hypothetical protein
MQLLLTFLSTVPVTTRRRRSPKRLRQIMSSIHHLPDQSSYPVHGHLLPLQFVEIVIAIGMNPLDESVEFGVIGLRLVDVRKAVTPTHPAWLITVVRVCTAPIPAAADETAGVIAQQAHPACVGSCRQQCDSLAYFAKVAMQCQLGDPRSDRVAVRRIQKYAA